MRFEHPQKSGLGEKNRDLVQEELKAKAELNNDGY